MFNKAAKEARGRIGGGKTDKYEWTQTDEDVDIYVYVPKGKRSVEIPIQAFDLDGQGHDDDVWHFLPIALLPSPRLQCQVQELLISNVK